jgi:thiol:disulfide interchange protein
MFHPLPMRRSTFGFSVLSALFIALAAGPAFGQAGLLGEKERVGLGFGGSSRSNSKLAVETSLTADRLEAGATATLAVTVVVPAEFHIYSMDPGYSGRTRIELAETPGLEPLGEFTADRRPKTVFDAALEQETEQFEGRVTWSRPMRVTDPAKAAIKGTFRGTYCREGAGGLCIPAREALAVKLTQTVKPAGAAATFTKVETPQVGREPGPATLRFSLAPEGAKPGDTVTLSATMTLGEGWHTYAITQPKVIGAQATAFKLEKAKGLTPFGETFVADQEPERKTLDTETGKSPIEQHSKTVTWTRQFRVDDAAYGIEGSIRYVTCDDDRCLQPKTVTFALGSLNGAGPVPGALPGLEGDALAQKFSAAEADAANLPLFLGLAFLGGLILNVMPCVLPVVAIKVMSFVQQAGENRGRVFALNAVYSLGVISVFLLLAALAALPEWFGWLFEALGLESGEFSWGGLFQSEAFTVVMVGVVFALGMSLLGAFEIPIPGMIGSAAGSAQREGLPGAFMTGAFATLLATPCTGPFMGSALFWSVKQPPAVTFLVWATMGLGMASPYLLFGLVPGAVKLIPKPGMWMVHFKQFAGFILMGTVVWLMSNLKSTDIIPLLVMLLGVGVTLWMIGTVQPSPSAAKRRIVTVGAIALGLGIGAFGYGMTVEPTHKLAWEQFSTERLNELRNQGKPVLIDFTADWCQNCHWNERFALNTKETKALVQKHGVVPLVADFSDESPEIQEWLDRFGALGVPLTVIFPANRPNDPIVLDGVYTQGTLLKSLDEAVKPKTVASTAVKTAATR